jgi:hypothetical protein
LKQLLRLAARVVLLAAAALGIPSLAGAAQTPNPFTAGIDACDNLGSAAASPRLPSYNVISGAVDLPLVFVPGAGWFRVRLAPAESAGTFRLQEIAGTCEAHPSPASYLIDRGELYVPEIEAVDQNGSLGKYDATLIYDPASNLFVATRIWDFVSSPPLEAGSPLAAAETPVPAVQLADTLGPYAAGDRIPLSRIQGGRIGAPESGCSQNHLHGTITIDGSGPYPDPNPTGCGHGVIVSTDPTAPTSVVTIPVPAGTEYCGPDITNVFFARLRVMAQRLAALPNSEKGIFDGTLFLARNGRNMDFEVGAIRDPNNNAVCPTPACSGMGFTSTFTLCGRCMISHIDNDIEYGLVAQALGVPWSVQLAGAHAWDLYQRQALDPLPSQAAYAVGNVLGALFANAPAIPDSQVCTLLSAVSLRTGIITWTTAFNLFNSELTQFGKGTCQPCPHGCPEVIIRKDFATQSWELDNGTMAPYQPGQ